MIIDTTLDSMRVDLIRKYFRKVRGTPKSIQGRKGKKLKMYKSHHRVPETTTGNSYITLLFFMILKKLSMTDFSLKTV